MSFRVFFDLNTTFLTAASQTPNRDRRVMGGDVTSSKTAALAAVAVMSAPAASGGSSSDSRPPATMLCALLSGAVAGASVDTALFPLDTIKTRMQSEAGFFKAGGFNGVYNGLGAAVLGSAPGAAMFFAGYEGGQQALRSFGMDDSPLMYALAGSAGEVVACTARVPTENVKQNMQMGKFGPAGQAGALRNTVKGLLKERGAWGLWRCVCLP